MTARTFPYTVKGDKPGRLRHTRSGKWLEDLEPTKPLMIVARAEQDASEHDYRPECLCSQCLATYTAHLDAGSIDGFALYDDTVPPMPHDLEMIWTPRSDGDWYEPPMPSPIHDYDNEHEEALAVDDVSDADMIAMLDEVLRNEENA